MGAVIPPPGKFGETAAELLALAGPGRVDEIRTRTIGYHGFEVPDDVAEAYAALMRGDDWEVRLTVEASQPVVEEEPVPPSGPERQVEQEHVDEVPVSTRRPRRRSGGVS